MTSTTMPPAEELNDIYQRLSKVEADVSAIRNHDHATKDFVRSEVQSAKADIIKTMLTIAIAQPALFTAMIIMAWRFGLFGPP